MLDYLENLSNIRMLFLRSIIFVLLALSSAVEDSHVFLNLPQNVSVPENSPGGTLVFELMTFDPFSHEYSYLIDPPDTTDFFDINIAGHTVSVKHGAKLDFETQTEYKIDFISTLTNDSTVEPEILRRKRRSKRLTADTDHYTLLIMVTDVNESPTFSSDVYFFTVEEGPANKLLDSISVTAVDPDNYDVISYSLTTAPNNDFLPFSVNASTGKISYDVEYDVDMDTMPDKVLVYVHAHDSHHAMDSSMLVITIVDINDNAPSFSSGVYIVFVPLGLPVSTTVLNLTVSDPDKGLGRVDSLRKTKSSSKYFDIKVNGSVYISRLIDTNITQIITVIATDGYGLQGTTTVTVSIVGGEEAHTLSASRALISHSEGVACSCVNEVKKLYWMIPLPALFCSSLLAVLILVTRKRNKISKESVMQ